MKRMRAILTAALVGAVGMGAGVAAYPPDAPTLVLSASTVEPGAVISVTFSGCSLGETVTVTVDDTSVSETCDGTGGGAARAVMGSTGATATVSIRAPTEPGTYLVTAIGHTSGVRASATLTVVAPGSSGGELPATGGDSLNLLQVAAGAIAAGVGLVFVSLYRRRRWARC